MKIQNRNVLNFVNHLEPFKNPILLYGPDEGLVYYRSKEIIKTFFNNNSAKESIKVIDLKNKDADNLEEIIKTNSLFSKKEIIKIINSNETLSSFFDLIDKVCDNKDLLIILTAGDLGPKSKLRKHFEEKMSYATIPCYKTESLLVKNIIMDFAKKNNIKIEGDAAYYLATALGNNYQIIMNELEKLLLINGEKITYELVKKLVSQNESYVYEDMVFDCLNGKINFFQHNIDLNIQDIYSANILLFNIKNTLLLLSKTMHSYKKTNIDEAVSQNMPKYLFKKRQVFEKIVKKKTLNNIMKCMEIVSEIELKIRQNQNMYKIFLIRGMFNIAQNMR